MLVIALMWVGVFTPRYALAWGDEGHRIISAIALPLLTPQARDQAEALLAADADTLTAPDFVSRATWADRWRDSDRNGAKIRYNATEAWHFVDVELTAPDLAAACLGFPADLDETAAAASLFAGLAASGWLTAAVTIRFLVEGGAPIAEGVVGAGVEISWPRPTRPGDELQVVSEVTEITPSRSKPDRGIVVLRRETRNQRGEIVQVLTSKLVVPRRPSGAADGRGT